MEKDKSQDVAISLMAQMQLMWLGKSPEEILETIKDNLHYSTHMQRCVEKLKADNFPNNL